MRYKTSLNAPRDAWVHDAAAHEQSEGHIALIVALPAAAQFTFWPLLTGRHNPYLNIKTQPEVTAS